ncbi:uncharacterized protein FIBRA_09087 [Fibroporia radiculosa]|uniref:C2H2-type domain-containing protein n=1 Tax=Fibroporia radiculosa TaxID=599839 RepID=J4I3T0_9APHY|nr:uncharacterized protein FIBRA_09087 [Fibroporia radiculosa]CCM06787.1 predicted protein [Fibroporia radiculosa]
MGHSAASPSLPPSAAYPRLAAFSSSFSPDDDKRRISRFPLSPLPLPRQSLPPFSSLRTTVASKPTSQDMQSHTVFQNNHTGGSFVAPSSVLPIACEECAHTCADAPCAAELRLSEECTDQCVVIACNDTHHPVAQCNQNPPNGHCDAPCPRGADCTGWDELFQCCTDYHEYSSEQKGFSTDMVSSNNTFSWDPSFAALLRGCTDPTHLVNPQHNSGNLHSITSNSPPSHAIFHHTPGISMDHGSVYTATEHQFPSDSQPAQVSQSQSSTFYGCQWGGCSETFPSLEELVGHVNLQHLRLPRASDSSHIPQTQQSVPGISGARGGYDANALACMWADCQIYPTSQSIPGSSTSSSADNAIGLLATHLLQDHLGLSTRLPKTDRSPADARESRGHTALTHSLPTPSTFSSPSPHSSSPTPSVASSHRPPTPLPEHDCTAPSAHACRWFGCMQTFSSCDALTTHITVDHVGGGQPYVCDFPGCGKAFAITGALTIHKRTHNGHKPFKCTYCDRAFAESSNLSKHLRTHTGVRPYLCMEPGCNKSFARPDQLARHQNVHKRKQLADSEAASVEVH